MKIDLPKIDQAEVGHVYLVKVVAVSAGERPQVRLLDDGPAAPLYPIGPLVVNASALFGAPMRYFHDEVPT